VVKFSSALRVNGIETFEIIKVLVISLGVELINCLKDILDIRGSF
jgi:hypothetical protein